MNKTFENVCHTLIGLDLLLTQKSKEQALHTNTSQSHAIATALEGINSFEYYLSDGGYSRIWIDPFKGKVFLTDNSLTVVKERWGDERVQNLVNDLLEFMGLDIKRLYIKKEKQS